MGKQVKVVTKCGETFTYDHDQEVETVEIVEKKTYKLQDRLKQIIDNYDKGCGGVKCDDCAFHMEEECDCAFVGAKDALMEAQGYDASVS